MNRTSLPRTGLRLESLESRDTPASFYTAFGAAPGGRPLVSVYRPDGTQLAQFQAFESSFTGGVRAAAGELDGNPATLEVAAAAGPGGGPRVELFRIDLATGRVSTVSDFFAFEPTFTGGVRVTMGNVADRPDRQQLVVAADDGGGPLVKTFALAGDTLAPIQGPLGAFFAYESSFRGGVRVAAGELDGNLLDGDELIVAAGPGGGPRVRVFRSDGAVLADYFAFRSGFLGGAQVSVRKTGGTDVPVIDGLALDFSQRNYALNLAAGVPGTVSAAATTTASNVTGQSVGTNAGLGTNLVSTTGTSNNTLTSVNPTFGPTGTTFTTGLTGTQAATTGLTTPGVTTFTNTGTVVGTTGTGIGVTSLGTGGAATTTAAVGFGPYGDPGALTPFPILFVVPFDAAALVG